MICPLDASPIPREGRERVRADVEVVGPFSFVAPKYSGVHLHFERASVMQIPRPVSGGA